jgi:hypothetical protein
MIIHNLKSKIKYFVFNLISLRYFSRTSNKPIIQIKEQSNDSLPKYQSVVLNEGARIRIVNCSNDSNNKQLSSRNSTKQFSNSLDKLDENWSTKSTRINTRNSKTVDILEINPTYQAQSVLLSNHEISNRWLTNNVFYRCHACSHEEFFVVLSRECMRLHVSSKHGNMEENFKQRISNFLNNQGRALKIFQHYLKWQQPWSEKEIDQIFQLANINNRTNGNLNIIFLEIKSKHFLLFFFRCFIEWYKPSDTVIILYLLVQFLTLSFFFFFYAVSSHTSNILYIRY